MAGNLTAMIASIFSGGVTPDPYFKNTTLLLPGNGTNLKNNNEFLDSSSNAFTVTRNPLTGPNAPTQGTFSPFSQTGWGNYFSGSSQYLSIANNAVFDFNADPFTIEMWFYITGNASLNNDTVRPATLLSAFPTSGSTANTYNLYIDGNNTTTGTGIGFSKTASGANINVSYSGTISQNTWHHVAVVRSSSTTLTLYLNGQQVAQSTSYSGNVNTGGWPIYVAQLGYTGYINAFPGYVSNVRVTKGRAVYTAAFNPPTAPLTRTTGGTNPPQGTECSLLTCQSNRFLDSNGVNTPASSPLTITLGGSPSVQAFSPFNPTASWSAATYGGSGYFDGSGDYLSITATNVIDVGTNDFTLSYWYYPTEAYTTTAGGFHFGNYTSTSFACGIGGTTIGAMYFTTLTTGFNTTSVPVLNAWNYIVWSRVSGTLYGFLNGNAVTISPSASFGTSVTAVPVAIGAQYGGTAVMKAGYISDMRFVKNSGVTSVTVPTAPLTAITNTSLLLNFTNGGIYDATSKNDLETVGNAQISTAQSKSGSSSILLAQSGTNDYITSPDSPLWQLTGDFTIEAWIYPTSLSGTNGNIICSQWPGGTATNQCFQFLVNSTGKVSLVYGIGATNAAVTGTSQSAVTNNWNHVAVSRQGSTVRFFVNGNLDTTTGTVSGALNNSTGMLVVGRINATDLGYFTGYIDDLRITNGVARYTSSFTPESSLPLQ